MWWLWPHFKRLWAAAGAIAVGLAVNYLFALWGRQSVPDLGRLSDFLYGYWGWTGGGLSLFAMVSVFAARAHRRHAAPHFIGAAPSRKRSKRPPLPTSPTAASKLMVGREGELAQLRDWFASVRQGERRVVFVSGEAGIGKTTFVNTFIDSLRREGVRIGRGQCVEQYGAGEPYMPMLEALTQLGRGAEGSHLLAILHRLAPAWLAQLPALLTAAERARIQGETQGLTQQRMLREMAETLAALAADAPLVILLEDLHWSDASTLDLIAAIARRSESARLLILGTYRPVEMLAGDHPLRALKLELELHGHCHELRLKLLSETEVAAYLGLRFANDVSQYSGLAPAIYQRTDGNPLFMVNVVDYLKAQGPQLDASKIETPRNIRQMIERNLERLTADEQSVLESASVAGAEFSAAAVAAALERPVSEVEACCTRLSRKEQFVSAHGMNEWPDGTVASSFRFHHALYGDVLYERVPAGHRVELHRRIAEREERAYGEHASEIASELAHHYRQANAKNKAIQYFGLAGQQALQRAAHADAIGSLTAALELLQSFPDGPERIQRELPLQLALGPAFIAVKGWGAPEMERAFARARELCSRLGDPPELFPALSGLAATHMVRAELRAAKEMGEQLLRLAEKACDPRQLLWAHSQMANVSFHRGDLLVAREHNEAAIALYDRERDSSLRHTGIDVGVVALSYGGWILWHLGYADQALKMSNEAQRLAEALSHPDSIAFARGYECYLRHVRVEIQAVQEIAERQIVFCAEYGLATFLAAANLYLGWAMAAQGRGEQGIVRIQEALATHRATGFGMLRPTNLATLVEACLAANRFDEGLNALTEALRTAEEHEEYCHVPEIHRLRGELLLRRDASNTADAQHCFEQAIEIARKQSAKSWELRATTSLARLLDQQGHRDEARAMLADIYNWFTEGFDTADLKEAKALLDELSVPVAPPRPPLVARK